MNEKKEEISNRNQNIEIQQKELKLKKTSDKIPKYTNQFKLFVFGGWTNNDDATKWTRSYQLTKDGTDVLVQSWFFLFFSQKKKL